MASGRMAPSNAKSGRNVDPTLGPDSRLAFRRQVRQRHGTHGTQGIIFADASPGWHPTAPLWLAPYCYSPAGTLLLIIVDWYPLCPVAPLAHPPLSLLRFTLRSQTSLRLQLIMLFHCLLGLSETPTGRHLPVSPDREPASPLQRLAAGRFG